LGGSGAGQAHVNCSIYRERPPRLQSPCSCPSTPPLRLSRSNVSVGDLQRAPARCSIRPVRRSKLQVAAFSRADASHGLFVTSTTVPLGALHPARGTRFTEYMTACRAHVRTCTELYGSATSVWVQASPQSELMGPSSAGFALAPGLLPYTHLLDNLYAAGWRRQSTVTLTRDASMHADVHPSQIFLGFN